jgi:formylglycine-generating enzyme required for sulfatase activity
MECFLGASLMLRAWRRASFVVLLGAGACADLAGIEAGNLRQASNAGANSGGASPSAGSNGSGAPNVAGSPAGGTPNASGAGGSAGNAGNAGNASVAGAAQGGTSTAGANPGGASNAGATSSAGSGGAATGPCPPGMVVAYSGQGVPFCIDAYEVTNIQYLAFTQQHTAALTTQIAACSGNASFVAGAGCAQALSDVPSKQVPVVCVDWCDAHAYCTSLGKHLCGRVGGTKNPPAAITDPEADEWYAACFGANENVTSGNACNDASFDTQATAPKAASQIPDCEGGVSGVFNLSGNVAEWENSCDSDSASSVCYFRGGSYVDGPYELQCSSSNGATRLTQSATLGLRCCAESR